jgi:hypothetical protein
MGAFSGVGSVAWAITPFLGLQVRHVYGDATMWYCIAAFSLVSAVLGVLAARGQHADPAVASLT